MKNWTIQNIIISTLITILCIACFPLNLLVIFKIIKPDYNICLYWIGWAIWLVGMLLVISPLVLFPRHGAVPRRKTFVHTKRIVTTGIYGVVRHPQYLGGILSVFVTTILLYPHWLFVVLGVIGSIVVYLGSLEEDKRLCRKFGKEYEEYMIKVPRMNILLGIFRLINRKQQE